MQVLFNFGKSFVGSHMFTLGLLYILSSLSRASKEKQHRSWRWSSWLRVSWAALPGWFVATGLRFLSEGPFRGRLAGCHGAGLLAQSTIPGTAGKDVVYFLSFCFIWLDCSSARCDFLSCPLSGRHGVGPGELWCLYRPSAEQTKDPRRETLHHQPA